MKDVDELGDGIPELALQAMAAMGNAARDLRHPIPPGVSTSDLVGIHQHRAQLQQAFGAARGTALTGLYLARAWRKITEEQYAEHMQTLEALLKG
jgi:hypothetical protein